MFCFVPLLAMEIIIPRPTRITTPITIQVVSMFCRMPSFQSAARTPPMSKANPKKYIPAHFTAHLLIGDWLRAYWTLPGRGQFHADNMMLTIRVVVRQDRLGAVAHRPHDIAGEAVGHEDGEQDEGGAGGDDGEADHQGEDHP